MRENPIVPSGSPTCSFVLDVMEDVASVPSVTTFSLNGTTPEQTVTEAVAPLAILKNRPHCRFRIAVAAVAALVRLLALRALVDV